MRKKLLAVFSAILIVCSLGMVGMTASALDSSKGTAAVTDVNYTNNILDFAGPGVIVNLGVDNTAYGDWENLTTALSSYVTLVGSNGANKLHATNGIKALEKCIIINHHNDNFAVGDVITLKAGLPWANNTELKQTVTYTYSAVGQPWTKVTNATKDEVTVVDVNYTDNYAGWAGSAIAVRLSAATNLTDWYDITSTASSKVAYVGSDGTNKLTKVSVQGEYLLINHQSSTVPVVGDVITLKSGLLWGDSYEIKSDISYKYTTANQPWTVTTDVPSGGGSVTPDPDPGTTVKEVIGGGALDNSKTSITPKQIDQSSAWNQALISFMNVSALTGYSDTLELVDVNGYITYTDSNGNDNLQNVLYYNQHLHINTKNGTFATGDILTIKKGFIYGNYQVKEDLVYIGGGVNQPYTKKTDASSLSYSQITVSEIHIYNHNKWGTPSIQIELSGFTSNFNPSGNPNFISTMKLEYVKANGDVGSLADFTYVGVGLVDNSYNFVVRLGTSLGAPGGGAIGSYEICAGDKLTIKSSGYVTTNNQHAFNIPYDVTYIVTNPDSDTGITTYDASTHKATNFTLSGNTSMAQSSQQQLTWTLTPSTAYGVPKFTVNNSIVTVDANGVVSAGMETGTATITATLNGVTRTITVTVSAPASSTFHVKRDVAVYKVPMAIDELGLSYTLLGQYNLKYYYDYNNGESQSALMDVTESMLSAIDYTTKGTKTVTITDPNDSTKTDTINVEIYEVRRLVRFDTFGVGDYDAHDSLCDPANWRGHMLVGLSSVSSNSAYLMDGENETGHAFRNDAKSLAIRKEMTDKISYLAHVNSQTYTYENADPNSPGRMTLWQLDSTFLISLIPVGATTAIGYADPSRWTNDVTAKFPNEKVHGYVPVYQLGDMFTFKKGFPVYKLVYQDGYVDDYILEAIVPHDLTYVCTISNGTDNEWSFFQEYTDFTLAESIDVGGGESKAINPVRVPSTSTTGTFSYVSNDETIATVTSNGNVVGRKVGTTTVTVTLTGGKDPLGNAMAPIVKTITVNVVKAVSTLATLDGNPLEFIKNVTPDLSQYKLLVTYSDDSTEEISMNDERLTVGNIDVSTVVASKNLRVKFLYNGAEKTYTIKIKVREPAGAYTATFDSDGGTIVSSQTVSEGNKFVAPPNPTRQADANFTYEFDCWMLNGVEYDFNTIPTGDIILVAKWTKTARDPGLTKFTVSFYAEDGVTLVEEQQVVQGEFAIAPTYTKPSDGEFNYVLEGWYLWGAELYDLSTPVTEDIMLVARWTAVPVGGEDPDLPTTYTVTFDSNGGTAVASQTVNANGLATAPTAPTKAGNANYNYVFAGWKLNGENYDFATPVTGNITLVASWIVIPVGGGDIILVEGVIISAKEHTMNIGETFTLTAIVQPENADNKNVSWRSVNTEIATVEGGVVTAIKAGTVAILVTTEIGEYADTCVITVVDPNAPTDPEGPSTPEVEGLKLSVTTMELEVNNTGIIIASDATGNVTWTTSDAEIATVSNGVVAAKKAGIVAIVATDESGARVVCTITVTDPSVEPPIVEPDVLPEQGVGCGSSMIATAGLLPLALLGAGFILVKNKRNKK